MPTLFQELQHYSNIDDEIIIADQHLFEALGYRQFDYADNGS